MENTAEPTNLSPQAMPAPGRMSTGSLFILASIVVVALVIGLMLARRGMTQPTSGLAPDFEMTTFDGETYRLSDFRGQVVVINFWASWCGPCRMFAPVFEGAAEKHTDVVFGKVDTEAQQELAAAFNIRSIPTLMAFRENVLVFAQPGAMMGAQFEQLIKAVRDLDMEDVHAQVAAQAKESEASQGAAG